MSERRDPRERRVLIVGGGITGLTLAHRLRSDLPSPPAIDLVEAAPDFGGKIATERQDGFVMEAGPDSFVTRKRPALELVRELGLESRLRGTDPRHGRVLVLHKGRLVPLPEGMTLLVPTRLGPVLRTPLLSPWGKIRMALDLVRPARRIGEGEGMDDESLAAFVRRRFGREVLDTVAGPLLAGIHSADPERLSLQATFPRFAEMEQRHGSLIRAMRRARAAHFRATQSAPSESPTRQIHDPARRLPSPTSARMTLAGGMDELVTALVDRLSGAPPEQMRLRPGCRLVALSRRGEDRDRAPVWVATVEEGSRGERSRLEVDAVVLATPAAAAARVLQAQEAELSGPADKVARFAASPSAIVSLGFRRADVPHALDAYGLVVPARERRHVTACTWTSSKLGQRAPEGHALLRIFLGGDRNRELVAMDDDELIAIALREQAEILGAPAGFGAPPVLARVHRVRGGNPLYEVGHGERLAETEAACPPGLFFAGAAFHGVGIPDCIESARRTAARIAGHLELKLDSNAGATGEIQTMDGSLAVAS